MGTFDDIASEMENSNSQSQGSQDALPNAAFAEKHLSAFQTVLSARRAIRIFDGKPMPEKTMRSILAEATLAPTSSNLQTYQLYWVRNTEAREKLVAACMGQKAANTASELVVVVSRPDLWRTNRDKVFQKMIDAGTKIPASVHHYYYTLIPRVMRTDAVGFFNLFRRVLFFVTGLSRPIVRTPVSAADHRIFGHTQAALVSQTLMLSCTAHGYDTCPIGGMDAARIRKILSLPCGAEVSMVVAIGNRKPEGLYGPRVRLNQSDLVKEI